MKRLKTFTASLVILAAATLGAQTPNPLPVTGNLSSIIGAGLPYAGVSIQLQNCASPVSITGYSVIVQQGYQVRASSSGVVNTTVWPNDLIDCNGTTGNSQYMLSYVAGGAVQGTPQCYQVVSTQTVWNLNAQQPISCSQSPPNPQDGQFNNLNVTGFFTALGGNIQANSLEAKTTAIPGPGYDVRLYGAVGDGSTNDGPAINAAFLACKTAGGGFVMFAGNHTYNTEDTINTLHGCNILGVQESLTGNLTLPYINFVGGDTLTSNAGTTFTATNVAVANNSTPYYTAANPSGIATAYSKMVTVTGTGFTALANQWIAFSGCTSTYGLQLNNAYMQLAVANSTTLIAPIPENLGVGNGSSADTCTITIKNVSVASDGKSGGNESIRDLAIRNSGAGGNAAAINYFIGSRPDVNRTIWDGWFQSATDYNIYVPLGSLTFEMGGGFRCDGVACIYYRPSTAADGLHIHDGTMTAFGSAGSGAIVLDNSYGAAYIVKLTIDNLETEPLAAAYGSGTALVTMFPSTFSYQAGTQFLITINDTRQECSTSHTCPILQMLPADDLALSLVMNNDLMSGIGTGGVNWLGLPGLSMYDLNTTNDFYDGIRYSPSGVSWGRQGATGSALNLDNHIGDFNASQYFQDSIAASLFMYSDSALATLPSGTTLFEGQIIAPHWFTDTQRFSIWVVKTSGTTGALNGGATTCTGSGQILTVSSLVGISAGQVLSCNGTSYGNIFEINPSAMTLRMQTNAGTSSGTLAYVAPVLSLEMQFPTKTAAVPTAQEPYQQGDVLWNSAAASGVAPGWQNSTAIGSYTPVLSSGTIASVTVNSGGGPFPDTPACSFIGGGGTGATCTATVSANVVTAINVTAAGSGYVSLPQVVLKTKGTWLPFGLGGSVATSLNLNNVTESSNYTLTGSEGAVNIDNSGGPYTITLPASPAASGPVTIFPYNGTTNIAAGVGATLINIPSALTTLAPITVYYDGSSTWKCYSGACTTSAPVTSATGGTNTGTVTCLTAACTNISGTYSVVGGTFTTGNMLVLVWPTTTAVYRCWASQNGGVATYGIGHSVATATGMTITNGVSVTGVTVTIDYGCSQY